MRISNNSIRNTAVAFTLHMHVHAPLTLHKITTALGLRAPCWIRFEMLFEHVLSCFTVDNTVMIIVSWSFQEAYSRWRIFLNACAYNRKSSERGGQGLGGAVSRDARVWGRSPHGLRAQLPRYQEVRAAARPSRDTMLDGYLGEHVFFRCVWATR